MQLRLAWRNIRRRPVASTAIVLAVALAVAVNAALFSVLDGLLFRPLPFPDPDRIFTIDIRDVNGQLAELVYRPEFADRREALRDDLERSPLVTAASQAGHASFLDRGEAEDLGLEVHGVDADFFTLFGLTPILGNALTIDDERSPAATDRLSPVPLPVVIGHGLWQRLWGGDPSRSASSVGSSISSIAASRSSASSRTLSRRASTCQSIPGSTDLIERAEATWQFGSPPRWMRRCRRFAARSSTSGVRFPIASSA